MKNLPNDYQEKMLKRVREITVDEVKTALKEQVWPVFTPGEADVLVTCAPVSERHDQGGFGVSRLQARDPRSGVLSGRLWA